MPARIHYVTIAVVDKAAERLSQLPPKEPENIPISGAIQRLRPKIDAALNNGYSLDDAVEILRDLDEVFTRVSVKTIRRYFDADDVNVSGSRPKTARRRTRNAGARPQPHETGSGPAQSAELPSMSGGTGVDNASAPSPSAAGEVLPSEQNAGAMVDMSAAQASPTVPSLPTTSPASPVPADLQTTAPASPVCVARRSHNGAGTASDNVAFQETM